MSYKSMKTIDLDILIYGSMRNCSEHFFTIVSNIELFKSCFNKICVIILEDASTDNTRKLLQNWIKEPSKNIIKYSILSDCGDGDFSSKSHRIAHCKNAILEHITTKNLYEQYTHAIDCEFNDLWCINFDGVCDSFRHTWDAISCVGKNKQYYDYNTLCCEPSIFNKELLGCIKREKNIEEYMTQFTFLLKDTKDLIKVNSAFNGLAIYKLEKLKNCRYGSYITCKECENKNQECFKESNHTDFYSTMLSSNVFINPNMEVESFPGGISYETFIKNMEKSIPDLKKNVLLYLLVNDFIKTDGLWLEFGTGTGISSNHVSHYSENIVYSFDSFMPYQNTCNEEQHFKKPEKINKNVEIVEGWFSDTIPSFKISHLKEKENYISFLHIDCDIYRSTCQIFDELYKYINTGTIIVFGKLINHTNYHLHQLKAFYEFVQRYNIEFQWIGMNGEFSKENIIIFDSFSNTTNTNVGVIIVTNPFFEQTEISNKIDDVEYKNFDWEAYVSFYPDLSLITTATEAWDHWINYGKKEFRTYFDISEETFDWKTYISENADLSHISDKYTAWNHWINHGKLEKRKFFSLMRDESITDERKTFDWISYKNFYSDLSLLNSFNEAWNHWETYGKLEGRQYFSKKINKDEVIRKKVEIRGLGHPEEQSKFRFDWIKYKNNNSDLFLIETLEEAWHHWTKYGKAEGRTYFSIDIRSSIQRVCSDSNINSGFNWFFYINNYDDLSNLTNEEYALDHWINIGKNEGRSGTFDWCSYIENLNLHSIGINSKTDAFEHWLNNGKKTYYVPDDFNWIDYVKKNNDLLPLITNESEAIYHWLNFGMHEKLKY